MFTKIKGSTNTILQTDSKIQKNPGKNGPKDGISLPGKSWKSISQQVADKALDRLYPLNQQKLKNNWEGGKKK